VEAVLFLKVTLNRSSAICESLYDEHSKETN